MAKDDISNKTVFVLASLAPRLSFGEVGGVFNRLAFITRFARRELLFHDYILV